MTSSSRPSNKALMNQNTVILLWSRETLYFIANKENISLLRLQPTLWAISVPSTSFYPISPTFFLSKLQIPEGNALAFLHCARGFLDSFFTDSSKDYSSFTSSILHIVTWASSFQIRVTISHNDTCRVWNWGAVKRLQSKLKRYNKLFCADYSQVIHRCVC